MENLKEELLDLLKKAKWIDESKENTIKNIDKYTEDQLIKLIETLKVHNEKMFRIENGEHKEVLKEMEDEKIKSMKDKKNLVKKLEKNEKEDELEDIIKYI